MHSINLVFFLFSLNFTFLFCLTSILDDLISFSRNKVFYRLGWKKLNILCFFLFATQSAEDASLYCMKDIFHAFSSSSKCRLFSLLPLISLFVAVMALFLYPDENIFRFFPKWYFNFVHSVYWSRHVCALLYLYKNTSWKSSHFTSIGLTSKDETNSTLYRFFNIVMYTCTRDSKYTANYIDSDLCCSINSQWWSKIIQSRIFFTNNSSNHHLQ